MSPTLRSHRYGKQRVRLTHLDRSTEPHRLTIVAVGIALEGDFAESYTAGDNRKVVATDSMKNTVYVLARERGVESIEAFGVALARHFVERYVQVDAARIELEEELWAPIALPAGAAPDAFERTASELGTASVALVGGELEVVSGIDGLQVLKSSHSGFVDFVADRYRTLPDVADRLFATSVRVSWRLASGAAELADHRALREEIRTILVQTFAVHHSLAVQQTLHAMGSAVLEGVSEVAEITLVLPNQHHLLVHLAPFGLDNPNRVFVGTDEPYGQIEATLSR
jgi:urate oxidase